MIGATPQMRRRRGPRAGFTVIELLLALALGTLVVLGAMSAFSLLLAGERRHSDSFDNQLDLLILQGVMRRATDSMVAAAPLDDSELTEMHNDAASQAAALLGAAESGDEDEAREAVDLVAGMLGGEEEEQASTLEELIEAADGDEELLTQMIMDTIFFDLPNFELYYETNHYERTLPVIDVVLQSSPLPAQDLYEFQGRPASMPPAGYVRGRFEFLQLEDELLLMWQPVDPPGLGVVLLEGVEQCAVEALVPRGSEDEELGWVSAHAAYLREQFPPAIRVMLWLEDGRHIDWLFETGVTTPDAVR